MQRRLMSRGLYPKSVRYIRITLTGIARIRIISIERTFPSSVTTLIFLASFSFSFPLSFRFLPREDEEPSLSMFLYKLNLLQILYSYEIYLFFMLITYYY